MGLIELLVMIVVVVLICAVAVWIIGQIPNAPKIIPTIIWVLCVFIVLWLGLTAIGVTGHDVRIPHI